MDIQKLFKPFFSFLPLNKEVIHLGLINKQTPKELAYFIALTIITTSKT